MPHWDQFVSLVKLNKGIIIGVLTGFGIGIFIRDILLWKKKEECYLKEITKDILDLKFLVSQLKNDLNMVNETNISLRKKPEGDWDRAMFEDAVDNDTDDNQSFYSFTDELSEQLTDFILDFDKSVESDIIHSTSQCYELCRSVSWKYQDFENFQWRYAMALYFSTLTEDLLQTEKQSRLYTALEFALKSIEKCADSSDAHKWLGVLYGVTGLFESNRDKIIKGKLFKDHIDKCLELNPNDSYAYLLKGRFCYQVYNLSFLERNLASLLFESPPTATMEDALEAFIKCEELKPRFYAANHLYLSLCYRACSDYTKSQEWLDSAKSLPLTLFDQDVRQQLENL